MDSACIVCIAGGFEGLRPSKPPAMHALLGRPISTSETAAAVAFLASDAASGITGEVLTISAGTFPVG